jgi:hypothetical protein
LDIRKLVFTGLFGFVGDFGSFCGKMKTMKHFVIIILALTTACYCYGQRDTMEMRFAYKNSVQAELGGHGLFYSLNYERILFNGKRFKTSGQVGFAYYPPSTGIIDLWIPVEISELISIKKHHIELGIGYVIMNESRRGENNSVSSRKWEGLYSSRIGYRYQKPNGRFLLRVSFTPLFGHLSDSEIFEFHPLGSVALGYSFGK